MRSLLLVRRILLGLLVLPCSSCQLDSESTPPDEAAPLLDEAQQGEPTARSCGAQTGWSRTFGGPENDFGYAVARDRAGNVVITGGYTEQIDLGRAPLTSHGAMDIFVGKFGRDGRPRWTKSFGGIGADAGFALATDRWGNVFVAGLFEESIDFGGDTLTSAGGSALFVVKLGPEGQHLWSVQLDDASVAELPGLAVDGSGHVVVTGTATLSDGQSTVFVVKYGGSGQLLWRRTVPLVADGASYAAATDRSEAVYISGFFADAIDFPGTPLTAAGSTDVFVAKYDRDGDLVFARSFGGADAEQGGSVAVTRSGHVLLAGSFMGTVDFGGGPLESAGAFDVFLVQLDRQGHHEWSRRFGAAAPEMCRSIAVDDAGDIWLTGTFFSGPADLGGGELAGAGMIDVFAARYDRRGRHLWSRALGGAQMDVAFDISASDAGAALLFGVFTGDAADFGYGPHASVGLGDVFLVRLAP